MSAEVPVSILRWVSGNDLAQLFLGKRVHAGLEFFYRRLQDGAKRSSRDVQQHMTESWEEAVQADQMQFGTAEDEASLRQKSLDLVDVYLQSRDVDEGFPIAVEAPLKCPLIDPDTGDNLGIDLFGFVDLILQTDNGPVIVDFKTAARSSAPLDVSHEIQLSCYSLAFRHVFGAVEHELQIRSLIKTKTPQVATHRYPPRDERHFRRLFAVVRSYLDNLRSRQFVYRPGWTCSMCDFRETHCRQWQG